MKKIKIIVEKTRTGYSAYAEKLPVATTGRDLRELTSNMVEAVRFYFDQDRLNAGNLDLHFSIPSLFDLYPINIRHFAKRIEMNYTLLSQYVQGRKVPSEKQLQRIVQGLREIGKELSSVSFK